MHYELAGFAGSRSPTFPPKSTIFKKKKNPPLTVCESHFISHQDDGQNYVSCIFHILFNSTCLSCSFSYASHCLQATCKNHIKRHGLGVYTYILRSPVNEEVNLPVEARAIYFQANLYSINLVFMRQMG